MIVIAICVVVFLAGVAAGAVVGTVVREALP